MNGSLLILLVSLLSALSLNAQGELPVNYFDNPLEIPLVLSGTFGELRNNHFHSGLDIKTQGQVGLKVTASAQGTISRIKISHYGYGKALYITHPNGYVTVYAHLNKFAPAIEAYVKKQQYLKEDFEIELFPRTGVLEVAQGDLIAYSGNTGGSGGPHLHFEIRDKNSRPMNPFLFGLTVKDTRPPQIDVLRVYPLDRSTQINGAGAAANLRLTDRGNGQFYAAPITGLGPMGFGVATIDQQDFANNKNGIYKIATSLNGAQHFEVTMNKFSFAETRYLNRMIDYRYYQDKGKRVQKLFIEKNNPLSIYKNVSDKGIILVEDSLSYQYTITIDDYVGNKVSIHIPIIGKRDTTFVPTQINETDHYIYSDQNYSFAEGDWDVFIPKGALYEDSYLALEVSEGKLKMHEDLIPVHKNIIISTDISNYRQEDREHLFIGRENYQGELYYTGARIKENRLSASTRVFGTYDVGVDFEPPTVVPENFTRGKWMSKYRYLKFKITDDLSGIRGYKATVNGQFILMEYDYKTDMLIHDFNDAVIKDGENNLKLIVTDNVGNSTTFETQFFRKQ